MDQGISTNHSGSGVQMRTQLATEQPETPVATSSIAPRVALQGFILDVAVECSAEDGKHADLEGIRMVIIGSNDEDCGGLLERSSRTKWEYRGVIELSTDMSELSFVIQSKDGSEIGYFALTNKEVKDYALAASFTGKQDVEHKFEMKENSHSLILKFAISEMRQDPGAPVPLPLMEEDYFNYKINEVDTMLRHSQEVGTLAGVCNVIGHPPEVLNNHGVALMGRFERTGDLDDHSRAIEYQGRALALTSEGDADMPSWLNNLANSFRHRFDRTGNLDDLAKAIESQQRAIALTPEGDANMPSRLNSLGNSFRRRFYRMGDLVDLSKALEYHHRAVALTPEGHANMPFWLISLGTSFRCRFKRMGDLDDLSKSIEYQHRAVTLAPEGHADMPFWLGNLGRSFRCRFDRTGHLDDLSKALEYHHRVVALTPEGHADMPLWLGNLGRSFRCRRPNDLDDLSKALEYRHRVVALTSEGHADMPLWLGDLGWSFRCRFERMGDLDNLSKAFEYQHYAVTLTPKGYANMPFWLNSLGDSLRCRFEEMGDLDALTKAIEYQHRAVALTPEGHADMSILRQSYGGSLIQRFELTSILEDCETANFNFHLATAQLSGYPSIRLRAARYWARTSMRLGDPAQTLQAYTCAVELLSLVAGLNQTIYNRHNNLVDKSSIASEAVVFAIAKEHTSTALEWLEQGRCLVWAQLNQLRTPVDKLREHDAHLANQFSTLLKALESSGSRAEEPSASDMAITHQMKIEDQARTHLKLAQEWNQLLARIRHLPDFYDFLRPRKATTILSQLPSDGSIVIINVDPQQCDALALIHGADEVIHIPLNDITHKKLEKLRQDLRNYLASKELLMRDNRAGHPSPRHNAMNFDTLRNLLQVLWKGVVQPILGGLGYCSIPPRRNRIWWCPTGPLSFLPLHAAGIYGSANRTPGSCLSDYAISSYIPTINTLLEKLTQSAKASQSNPKILLVSQPNTPGLPLIPGTTAETHAILTRMAANEVGAVRLERKEATTQRVQEELKSHQWVHFACHASQHPTDPLKSSLCFYNGKLELMDLVQHELPTAEFAFLSACETSVGDEKLSNEVVHLAAGMLAAGYRGVVGTMWSIKDEYAPKIAEDFYGQLLEERRDSGSHQLNIRRAAYALDHAIQKLRHEMPDDERSLLTWVPYAHYGL